MVKERDNKDASEVKTSGVGSAGSCEDRGAGNEDIDQEVAEFRHESRKIRKALSGIENTTAGKLTKWVNIAFIAALGTLFSARFVFDWIDYTMSIELGILLVSMKMIWMMRMQEKYNHFVFWILHSLEYRENLILKRLDEMEESKSED